MATTVHFANVQHQRSALDMLTLASARVRTQAALVAERTAEVSNGIMGDDDMTRLADLSSYLVRLTEERQEFQRFATFLGAHKDMPHEFLSALKGEECYCEEEELGTEEELARLREALTA